MTDPSRYGHCFRLAIENVRENAVRAQTLVHGRTNFADNHAWVEFDGQVYDPTFDREIPKADYYNPAVFGAVAIATYSPEEATVRMVGTRHYGPWHDDPDEAPAPSCP